MSSAYDPRPLVPYLRQLGVHYLYEQQDIMAQVMYILSNSVTGKKNLFSVGIGEQLFVYLCLLFKNEAWPNIRCCTS